MSVLIRFAPASLTAEQYDESIRRLKQSGDFPPDGLEYPSVSAWKAPCESARSGTRGNSCRRSGSA